ncbi:alpha/beta fold hydrolase [Trichothermofontia sp.]
MMIHQRRRGTSALAVVERGAGLPILCLHGHPGSAASMGVFTDHLCRHFRTIAPDLRGYGQSRTQRPFAMTDHLTDLEGLLAQQTEPSLILGWSLGGILALELALRVPDRVRGLVLIAAAARPRGNLPAITRADQVYTAIASLLNLLKPGWRWNIKTLGARSLYRYLLQRHTPQAYRYLAQVGTPAYLRTSRFATQALNAALRQGYDRQSDLHRITCPCLVMAASHDRHITAASSQAMAQALPQATWHLYEHTAHLFPWEIPDQVLADLDRWLIQHQFRDV